MYIHLCAIPDCSVSSKLSQSRTQLGQKLHRYYLLLPLCRVLIKFNCYYVQRTLPPVSQPHLSIYFCIHMLWLQDLDIDITTTHVLEVLLSYFLITNS